MLKNKENLVQKLPVKDRNGSRLGNEVAEVSSRFHKLDFAGKFSSVQESLMYSWVKRAELKKMEIFATELP